MATVIDRAERRTLQLGDTPVSFILRRSARRRTIGLLVDHDGLTVVAPLRAAEWHIDDAVREQSRWVLRTLGRWATRRIAPPTWRDGEQLPYLGGHATVRIHKRAVLHQMEFAFVYGPEIDVDLTAGPVVEQVVQWYRERALPHFSERAAVFAQRLGRAPRSVSLTNARMRWGSCSSDGSVRFNWRLIKAAPGEVDYVIAHELAHLCHMDHSKAFWETVARIYPDYRQWSRALDANDPRYRTF